MSDLRYCSCLPQVRFLDTRDHAPGCAYTRIAELEYALELVASGELMYPEQTARQALQEQEK